MIWKVQFETTIDGHTYDPADFNVITGHLESINAHMITLKSQRRLKLQMKNSQGKGTKPLQTASTVSIIGHMVLST